MKATITMEEFEPIKRETRRLSSSVRKCHLGEEEIRKTRPDIIKEEAALNVLFQEHFDTDKTFNFIGYFLYGLPTLYGVNELISGDEGKAYSIFK